MASSASVTTWIERLRAGDRAAAEPLWQRYYAQMVRLARDHLTSRYRKAVDEEDIAHVAFHQFYAGVASGRFPSISNRQDLWRLLLTITIRRAHDQARREKARAEGHAVSAADLVDLSETDLDRVASSDPDPALVASVADQLRHLLTLLREEDLQRVALAQMEGYTTSEIAEMLGCSTRTVERKWQMIRQFWLEHTAD